INECSVFSNICVYGECENILGMFRCVCNPGYRLDETGGNCTDIDECSSPASCQHGTCVNTLGSYVCQCPPNYSLAPSGTGCVDSRQDLCYKDVRGNFYGRGICLSPMDTPMSQATCCCTVGAAWGRGCDICPANNTNIDECAELDDVCRDGRCSNTFGSFLCVCPDGYTLDNSQRACIDVNECDQYPDVCGPGTCFNSDGSFRCHCPPDYVVVPGGKSCVDMRKNTCYKHVEKDDPRRAPTCSHPMLFNQTKMTCCCSVGKAWGSFCEPCPELNSAQYKTLCSSTPLGTIMNPITHVIDDVDECQGMVCQEGQCTNTIGSFVCQCYNGFRYDPNLMTCEDVDECKEPHICQNGVCINLDGGFQCTCNPGYYSTPAGDTCIDFDECARSPGICSNGMCENVPGSYRCVCNPGFQLSPDNDCYRTQYRICHNGRCRNTIGSFQCHCQAGYQLSPDGRSCVDINECETDVCHKGSCRNSEGSFECTCPEGYQLSHDGRQCVDVDECLSISQLCLGGVCENTEGGFRCSCPPGFKLSADARGCIDINECMMSPDICQNGECINTDGSYRCQCEPGFRLDPSGHICLDLNECVLGIDDCAFRCLNTAGSFRCTCPYGYTLAPDGKHCQALGSIVATRYISKLSFQPRLAPAIHEDFLCHTFPTLLADNRLGTCYRTASSCPDSNGLLGLTSRDECCCSVGVVWGSHCEACPQRNTQEFNSLCELGTGFNKDGQDVNECETMPHLCNNGRCINTQGSYRCLCNRGYKTDPTGTRCVDVNECELPVSPCKSKCLNTEGSYICSCDDGYVLAEDKVSCKDVDECATDRHNCEHSCINTQGSYRCSCKDGYNVLESQCLDVNECREQPHLCAPSGTCTNMPGSYRCNCPRGYITDASGQSCKDTDECADASRCPHGCENLEGSYRCTCPPGFKQHPYWNQCLDDNECLLQPCGTANCVNTVGSYSCSCPNGFSFDEIMTSCVGGSGCSNSPCLFECMPTGSGGFLCSCPEGYQRIGQGHCLSTHPESSTLGPGKGVPGGVGIPAYDVDNAGPQDPDKVISTEGCYSCKLNGGSVQRARRGLNNGTSSRRLTRRSAQKKEMEEQMTAHKRRHPKSRWDVIRVTLPLRQAQAHQNILDIRPAYKHLRDDKNYHVLHGVDRNRFSVVSSDGGVTLQLAESIKKAGLYKVNIGSRSPSEEEAENQSRAFRLRVHLAVTE
ncbi:hypothetical protein HPB47_026819, partial [Ixodes persulcatus]